MNWAPLRDHQRAEPCRVHGARERAIGDGPSTSNGGSDMFTSARSVSSVGVAVLTAALVACGSSGTGEAGGNTAGNNAGANNTAGDNTAGNNTAGNGSGTATASAYCTTAIGVQQDKFGACDKASDTAIRYSKQLANCVSYDKEVSSGRTSYDATKGTACAAAIANADCSKIVAVFDDAACQGVLSGNVASGGDCYHDMDCASGTCDFWAAPPSDPSAVAAPTCPGKCLAFLQQGEDCSGARAECGPNLTCYAPPGGSTRTCETLSAESGACPCKPGLYCDASGPSPSCKALKTSGACSSSSLECATGYHCVITTGAANGTCKPAVGLGGPCTPVSVRSECGMGYHCDPATSKCVPPKGVGETCVAGSGDSLQYLPCAPELSCDFGGTRTCKVPGALGAACTSDADCAGTCDLATHQCTSPAATTCAAP
jgi:hypothetical protein